MIFAPFADAQETEAIGEEATAVAPDGSSADGVSADAEAPEPLAPTSNAAESIMFYVVALTIVCLSIGCVISVNIVRMAMCLFGTLGSVAILYFLLSATFLGAIQLIVYAGGTLVVIIFGVMLTSQSPWARYVPGKLEIIAGAVVGLALFIGLASAIVQMDFGPATVLPRSYYVHEIGKALLTTYLVPFELASVLLLAVMIGAAFLARPERRN